MSKVDDGLKMIRERRRRSRNQDERGELSQVLEMENLARSMLGFTPEDEEVDDER